MKSIVSLAASLVFLLALSVSATGQDLDDAAIQQAGKETLLSMPEPPLGFAVSKHPLVVGEQLAGFQVQVMKEGAVSKVLVKVENRDFTDRGARAAARKGYINGFASGLTDAGFKVTASEIPDIEKSDLNRPLDIELTFANDDGVTVHVFKRMFFTKKGFDITVIATDENDFQLLSEWSQLVRPAPASAKP